LQDRGGFGYRKGELSRGGGGAIPLPATKTSCGKKKKLVVKERRDNKGESSSVRSVLHVRKIRMGGSRTMTGKPENSLDKTQPNPPNPKKKNNQKSQQKKKKKTQKKQHKKPTQKSRFRLAHLLWKNRAHPQELPRARLRRHQQGAKNRSLLKGIETNFILFRVWARLDRP